MRASRLTNTGWTWLPPRIASRPASTSTPIDFPGLDRKWQKIWALTKLGEFNRKKDDKREHPTYVLPMFPYPSGSLHMGHMRVYTISDVVARFNYMRGRNVLHPMGWDAFGLPAENAAIERGVDPAEWTARNIEQMKGQLQAMNGVWDWGREFRTSDPSYYKHTQQLFLMLHEAGLAYQKEALVNWDPVDNTVLANEQVDANGCSWRSGAKVKKRELRQWFLAITKFAGDLHRDLDTLEKNNNWPSRVVDMQRNWLGKSEGVTFDLEVVKSDPTSKSPNVGVVNVYTTRLDTLNGAQFIALSLGHSLVQQCAAKNEELRKFIEEARDLPPNSRAGFKLPYLKVRSLVFPQVGDVEGNLAKASRSILLPVYAAPYVLDGVGTGAVMGVPAHDTRDWEFWGKHQPNKAPKFVISPENRIPDWNRPFTEKGIMAHPHANQSHLRSDDVSRLFTKALRQKGHKPVLTTSWRLHDWLISRQRYWGAPIPIIHCPSCGAVPVPRKDLPVELPKLPPDLIHGRTGNPLEKIDEWINTSCPECSGPAKRDTDTMDTFMDSAWYYFRFVDPKNDSHIFRRSVVERTLPVDFYIGGVEHAILHLLYARFIAKFLLSTAEKRPGITRKDTVAEPFKKLVAQGMVHGKTYSDPATGRFLKSDEVDLSDPKQPKVIATGETPSISFEKMSKSKYNGVDPATCINKYGADVTRAHMLFAAPESEVLEWEDERIAGITRWLHRLWRIVEHAAHFNLKAAEKKQTRRLSHQATKLLLLTKGTRDSVTAKLEAASGFNTVVSDLIKLTNALDIVTFGFENEVTFHECVEATIKMVAPLAPAFAEEAWQILHPSGPENLKTKSIFQHDWPDFDDIKGSVSPPLTQTCVLMMNGKKKFAAEIPTFDPTMPRLGRFLKQQLLEETEEGREWAAKPAHRVLLSRVQDVFAGKGGTVLNLVLKKDRNVMRMLEKVEKKEERQAKRNEL
ncbi:leucyl-tRNA synthetase [Venturia nashicola]|uniref:leucine--tRNA ligase n=1 Tax=Venturia nashicola TaxID=86259 RepID=A0A4Z1NYU7_9PEZI|nr:leucyl-tRNA synthetase [Venturia nashicola]TLD31812.1 leucyl-tRNA synthetase [Venturia nashicola]